MRTEDNKRYYCDEGKVLRRKADGFIMGNGVHLGDLDTIENYEEVDNPNPEEKKRTVYQESIRKAITSVKPPFLANRRRRIVKKDDSISKTEKP